MTDLLVMTPTSTADTGWGRYATAVIDELEEHFTLTVVDDLTNPIRLRSRPDLLLRDVWRVRRKVRRHDAVCSLIAYPYALVAALATASTDIPYFVSCHGTYAVEPLHTKHRRFAKWAFSNATQLFPVSEFTADRLTEAIPDLSNITVIPNGIDTGDFQPADPYDLDHRVLLTVGAFKPRKGQTVAVEAFGIIADRIPDVEHHLVGSGVESDYATTVRETAHGHGVGDRVHFEGKVSQEELERWYTTADVFVLTPQYIEHHFEGFGLVYLEANRYGVPVVGTVGTGAEDAVAHNRSGLCVDNEAETVGEALLSLFSDNERYDALSSGAREWVKNHEWEHCLQPMKREVKRGLG